MKTAEEVAATLDGAQVFSVLDASQAFHQIRVSEETSKLLVYNTLFGHYKYKRLPFGICSAPKVWERILTQMFSDIPGAEIIRDKIIIKGRNTEEHDRILEETLARARERGMKFKLEKCEFAVPEVKNQGHIWGQDGVRIDPNRTEAIANFPVPENVDDVRRFLGVVNYVGKFVPNMSSRSEPLRILMNKDIAWHWENDQQRAFEDLKKCVSEAPVLKYCSLSEPIVVKVDASTKGVGACLLQSGKPVHYA